jgi:hypothetical protein
MEALSQASDARVAGGRRSRGSIDRMMTEETFDFSGATLRHSKPTQRALGRRPCQPRRPTKTLIRVDATDDLGTSGIHAREERPAQPRLMEEAKSDGRILAVENALQLASGGRAFWNLLPRDRERDACGLDESRRGLEVEFRQKSGCDPIAPRRDSKCLGSAPVADDIQ